MQPRLSREFLGLAGEYAVGSELYGRGMYAQLTLGTHKHTDLLVETELRILRISVKTKQGTEWPSVGGLHRKDDFLVLVDMQGKGESERPDFYVLNEHDWLGLVDREEEHWPAIQVDKGNHITYPDGWTGLNIRVQMVAEARERWDKIVSAVSGEDTMPGD